MSEEIICQKCSVMFNEGYIEESHDVPCYLFFGFNRNEKKNKADKFGRHLLCKDCHKKYEEELDVGLKRVAKEKTGYIIHNLGAVYAENRLKDKQALRLYFLCEATEGKETKYSFDGGMHFAHFPNIKLNISKSILENAPEDSVHFFDSIFHVKDRIGVRLYEASSDFIQNIFKIR